MHANFWKSKGFICSAIHAFGLEIESRSCWQQFCNFRFYTNLFKIHFSTPTTCSYTVKIMARALVVRDNVQSYAHDNHDATG